MCSFNGVTNDIDRMSNTKVTIFSRNIFKGHSIPHHDLLPNWLNSTPGPPFQLPTFVPLVSHNPYLTSIHGLSHHLSGFYLLPPTSLPDYLASMNTAAA